MTDQVDDTTLAAKVPLRVAVWNLNHWQQPVRPIDTRTAAWQYIADELRADVALLQGGTCRHLVTWKGFELDHVCVSPSLAGQVRAIRVDQTAVDAGLSDHVPLVLDLDLTRESAASEWSPETFAAELGRRHGPATEIAILDLIRWAEEKERRLRDRGIRDVDLTRLPTSRGDSPELWFQVDYRGPIPALMYSISIRARGDVVVQFQYMQQPPFDAPERRESLRQLFNDVPGIDLPAHRLTGRPTFPLSVLEDPDRRERVIGILDRIVDETRPTGGPASEAETAADSA